MKTMRLLYNILLIFMFIAGSFIIGTHVAFGQDDVVVIVHSSKATLTKIQIKRIFSGDVRNWPGGGRVIVLLNSDSSITSRFCRKFLGISKNRLEELWVRKGIRDGVPPPRNISSDVQVTLVKTSPKFIGIVEKTDAGTGVRIID